MAQPINVAVRCPKCNWRVMDKISPTTGKIEIKCPRCGALLRLEYPKDRADGRIQVIG